MPDAMWEDMVSNLRDKGVAFDIGLTDAEVGVAEKRYGFRFPPDLRAFLQAGLPSGSDFPNWRDGDEADLRGWLDLPCRGILFDVEHNGFWLDDWGPRPGIIGDAVRLAREVVQSAPRLIPVFKHRMMPSEPCVTGNPVFSVHQTDIIYYGVDLRDYLIHEFLACEHIGTWPIPDSIRQVPFWDIERFLNVRWSGRPCLFDNSVGDLP